DRLPGTSDRPLRWRTVVGIHADYRETEVAPCPYTICCVLLKQPYKHYPARMMRSAVKSLQSTLALFNLGRKLGTVKARGVIDKELALAFLTDVFSLEKEIDRAIESIAVRNI